MSAERAFSSHKTEDPFLKETSAGAPHAASANEVSSQVGSTATRIDSAHVRRRSAPSNPVLPCLELAEAAAGKCPPSVDRELLERHARGISERLRDLQRELDQRESEFNARVAQFEAESRALRLALREQQDHLAQREQALEEQTRVLSERSADLAAAAWAQNSTLSSNHEDSRERAQELRSTIVLWRDKIRELESQERRLQAQYADLANERQRLESEKIALLSDKRQQQLHLDQEREQIRQLREQQARESHDRIRELERRHEVVNHMHADLSRLYRESIETQICTETLWAQITERLGTAEASLKIATLRKTLADEYHLAAQHLAELHEAIRTDQQRLYQQWLDLENQRSELRTWFHRQQQQAEEQTRRLLEREQELAKREQQLQFASRQWDEQRRQAEHEIRRLQRLVRVV